MAPGDACQQAQGDERPGAAKAESGKGLKPPEPAGARRFNPAHFPKARGGRYAKAPFTLPGALEAFVAMP